MEARSIASRLATWSLAGSALDLTLCGPALFGKLRTRLLKSTDREGTSLARVAYGQTEPVTPASS